MGKASLSISRKRAATKRKTWRPTSVRGFIEPAPAIPSVKWRKEKSQKKDKGPSQTIAQPQATTSVAAACSSTQTDASTQTYSTTSDASTQTDVAPGAVDSFLHESLISSQQALTQLKENLFPASIAHALPFLLPYQLMCLVVLNIRHALHSMFTQNTGLRRKFINIIATGVDRKILAPILGFSQKTFQRALHPLRSSKPSLIGLRIKGQERKSKLDPAAIADARKILDVLAPVKSGKVFRVVSCPLNYLYEQYHALASQINRLRPVSYSYFIGKNPRCAPQLRTFREQP